MVWPVVTVSKPKGRPGATAIGSMLDVEDEEAVLVCLFGLDSDRKATRRRIRLAVGADRSVDFENGSAGRNICEILESIR